MEISNEILNLIKHLDKKNIDLEKKNLEKNNIKNNEPNKQMPTKPIILTESMIKTLKESLELIGIKVDENSLELAKILAEHNLSINKNNMQKLKKGIALFNQGGSANIDKGFSWQENIQKVVFIIKNDLPMLPKNFNILQGFLTANVGQGSHIRSLFENIATDTAILPIAIKEQVISLIFANMNIDEDTLLQSKILAKEATKITTDKNLETKVMEKNQEFVYTADKIEKQMNNREINSLQITVNSNKSEILNNLLLKFCPRVESKDKGDMINKLNKLYNNINEVLSRLPNLPETANVRESLLNMKSTLEFMNIIKESVFVPFPIVIADNVVNGELYVFKDGKNKNTRKKNSATALVALNTAYLGRIETYIKKTDKNLSLQFRVNNKEVQVIIQKNVDKLAKLLEEYNYVISDYTFVALEKSFNILNDERDLVERSTRVSINDDDISFDILL